MLRKLGCQINCEVILKVHQMYCTPVLFSGLASLVLTRSEVDIFDKQYQMTLQSLQRLHDKTPRSVVLFLQGRLPGEAELPLRQLCLFSMICHLPQDPLYKHAEYALTSLTQSSKSWLLQVRALCLQYGLPHPLDLLKSPLSKGKFTSMDKAKVTEYWQQVLSREDLCLSSLGYLNPMTASLSHPHPIWASSVGNSYGISKSIVLGRMVSGRYNTEMLSRFWFHH